MVKRGKTSILNKTAAVFLSVVMAFSMTPGGMGIVNADVPEDVATVTKGSVTTGYTTIQGAFTAATDGGVVSLLNDVTIGETETLTVGGAITVDLSGHSFTNNGTITDGQERPIQGEGAGTGLIFDCSNSGNPGVFNNAGTFNTNFQSFTSDTFNFKAGSVPGYVSVDGGTINVTGGSFTGGFMVENAGSSDVIATISNNAEIFLYEGSGVYVDTSDGAPGLSLTLNGGYYNVDPKSFRGDEGQYAEYVTLNDDNVEAYNKDNPQSDWTADPDYYTWRINSPKTSLNAATITEISDQLFTGDPIEPEVEVKLDGNTLKKDEDYTVSYENNIHCTATNNGAIAKVTGIGGYEGTVSKKFEIVKNDVTPGKLQNVTAKLKKLETGSLNADHYPNAIDGDIATVDITFTKQSGVKRYFVSACLPKREGQTYQSKAITGTDSHIVVVDNTKAYWDSETPLSVGPNGETITQTESTITVEVKTVSPSDSSWSPVAFADGENIEFFVEAQADDELSGGGSTKVLVPFAATSVGKTYDENGEVATTKKNLSDSDVKVALTSNSIQKYTGKHIEPGVHVYVNKKTLTEGTDYTLTYKDNINPGTATAIVKGKGDYEGENSTTFTIVDVSKYKDCIPTITSVTVEDIPLDSKGKVTSGEAKVTVGFTVGSNVKIVEFYPNIVGATTTGLNWPRTTERPGGGAPAEYAWKPDSTVGENGFTYGFGINTLSENEEQKVKDAMINGGKEGDTVNISATGEIVIEDVGYIESDQSNVISFPLTKDSIGKTFTKSKEDDKPVTPVNPDTPVTPVTPGTPATPANPAPVNISDAQVTVAPQKYSGSALTPALSVVVGGTTLVQGTDYDVAYSNNTNAGTAKYVLTGKGKYTGNKEGTFEISKAENTLTAKAKKKTLTVKLNKIKKRKVKIKKKDAFKISNGDGKISFQKTKGNSKITVSNKGVITVKKGLKKGKYNVTVKVSAGGDANHKAVDKSVTFKINVK